MRAYIAPRKAVGELAARDPRMAAVFAAIGPVRILQSPSSFETLARVITGQQLSGAAAGTIWGRVVALFEGGGVTPEALLAKRDATLRRAGLSAAKATSLRELARAVVSGELDPPGLADLPDDEVMERLTRVKGIGPWSARMHLMFALGRLDVWPVGDLGVRKGLARLLGRASITPREAEGIGEAWRPYRSIVAWSMWRVLDVEEWA